MPCELAGMYFVMHDRFQARPSRSWHMAGLFSSTVEPVSLLPHRTAMWVAFLCVIGALTLDVSAQNPGFLSLDCGGIQSFTDAQGIEWVPDDKYIATGSVASVSSEYPNLLTQYQRLRYFPGPKRKHCYTLPVIANRTYLVRPSFAYGNYDGLANPPIFDFQIGADASASVNTLAFTAKNSSVYYEFIVASPNDTLNLCLGSTSAANVPFISALVLRLMGRGMYQTAEPNQALLTLRRLNVGATSFNEISYPDDKYDRIWRPDDSLLTNKYPIISTKSTILPGDGDQPPSSVMRTAITSNTSIVFNFPFVMPSDHYYLIFYFAEFTTLSSINPREFNIKMNDTSSREQLLYGPLNVQAVLNGSSLTTLDFYDWSLSLNGPTSFLFNPTKNSALGPILNAAEIYLVKSNLSLGTHPDDVRAINDVKTYFHLLGWSGDPCLPLPYTWDWITCDVKSNPARITVLNLSHYELNGSIPQDITQLTQLTKILLDNNNLQGLIPDFSSLESLTILHMHNNNLSGSIPSSLFNISTLRELSLQNNNLDGCPPQGWARAGLTLNASGNPASSCFPNPEGTSTSKGKKIPTLIIAVAVPSAVVLLLLGILLTKLFHKRGNAQNSETRTTSSNLSNTKNKATSTREFTYQEINSATSGFQKQLGAGGFGPVYYGRLPDGQEVAVKVNAKQSPQGLQEFKNEIDVLSVVHHKNLVSFLGYCKRDSQLILIYEYLSNGTLREHLYGTPNPPLSWKTRLNIALDAAQGLDYLHAACDPQIIHRDVKSSNILLNEGFVAKVADFGLSKLYNIQDATHVSTMVKGTFGYVDPEYHSSGWLTQKSDVYSFGVVLLEIVCARPPILSLPQEQASLTKWAYMQVQKGELEAMVDSKLLNYNKQAVWKVVEIAMACTEHESVNRPTMKTVVNELTEAIRLEEESSYTDLSSNTDTSLHSTLQAR